MMAQLILNIVLFTFIIHATIAIRVTLYTEKNYKGKSTSLDLESGQCKNFPEGFQVAVSSIKFDKEERGRRTCFQVWDGPGCQGTSWEIPTYGCNGSDLKK